jgi:protein-tyrosine phosphatase
MGPNRGVDVVRMAERVVHTRQVRICFVCLGNICRSPTAEGVMAAKVHAAGLTGVVEVDSAGTGGWHRGEAADARARAEAARRGVTLTSRARQVHAGDFEYFDLLVAMDRANEADLFDLAPTAEARRRVRMLRSFAPDRDEHPVTLDVPDPYFGGETGFADVFDIIDAACTGLLAEIQAGIQAGGDLTGRLPIPEPGPEPGPEPRHDSSGT